MNKVPFDTLEVGCKYESHHYDHVIGKIRHHV